MARLALQIALAATFLAAAALAQSNATTAAATTTIAPMDDGCVAPPDQDPFAPTGCSAIAACDATFCGCAGASSNFTNATTCLAASSATCATLEGCLANYTRCLVGIRERTFANDDACNWTASATSWAFNMASNDNYNGSALQQACQHTVCEVMKVSALSCSFGDNSSRVCRPPRAANSTTRAPVSPPPATKNPGMCPAAPERDPFAPSACNARVNCEKLLCMCAGVNSSSNASQCLGQSNATCDALASCISNFTMCVANLGNQQFGDTVCNGTSAAVRAAAIAAATSGYNGSTLQQGCRHQVCVAMVPAASKRCNLDQIAGTACRAGAADALYAVRAKIRLSGSSWLAILNNTARRATLVVSLQTDIGLNLLKISPVYVAILDLEVGSLIINFAVLDGSGMSATQLTTAVTSAQTNTAWLSNTKSVYSLASNETLTVLDVSATIVAGGTTGAPVGPTPAPGTGPAASTTTILPIVSPESSGAVTYAVASSAMIAVAAAVLALF